MCACMREFRLFIRPLNDPLSSRCENDPMHLPNLSNLRASPTGVLRNKDGTYTLSRNELIRVPDKDRNSYTQQYKYVSPYRSQDRASDPSLDGETFARDAFYFSAQWIGFSVHVSTVLQIYLQSGGGKKFMNNLDKTMRELRDQYISSPRRNANFLTNDENDAALNGTPSYKSRRDVYTRSEFETHLEAHLPTTDLVELLKLDPQSRNVLEEESNAAALRGKLAAAERDLAKAKEDLAQMKLNAAEKRRTAKAAQLAVETKEKPYIKRIQAADATVHIRQILSMCRLTMQATGVEQYATGKKTKPIEKADLTRIAAATTRNILSSPQPDGNVPGQNVLDALSKNNIPRFFKEEKYMAYLIADASVNNNDYMKYLKEQNNNGQAANVDGIDVALKEYNDYNVKKSLNEDEKAVFLNEDEKAVFRQTLQSWLEYKLRDKENAISERLEELKTITHEGARRVDFGALLQQKIDTGNLQADADKVEKIATEKVVVLEKVIEALSSKIATFQVSQRQNISTGNKDNKHISEITLELKKLLTSRYEDPFCGTTPTVTIPNIPVVRESLKFEGWDSLLTNPNPTMAADPRVPTTLIELILLETHHENVYIVDGSNCFNKRAPEDWNHVNVCSDVPKQTVAKESSLCWKYYRPKPEQLGNDCAPENITEYINNPSRGDLYGPVVVYFKHQDFLDKVLNDPQSRTYVYHALHHLHGGQAHNNKVYVVSIDVPRCEKGNLKKMCMDYTSPRDKSLCQVVIDSKKRRGHGREAPLIPTDYSNAPKHQICEYDDLSAIVLYNAIRTHVNAKKEKDMNVTMVTRENNFFKPANQDDSLEQVGIQMRLLGNKVRTEVSTLLL